MNTNGFSYLNYTKPKSSQLPFFFSLLVARVVLVQVPNEFGSCFQMPGVIYKLSQRFLGISNIWNSSHMLLSQKILVQYKETWV